MGYEVVNVYPHDPSAFTQGLIFEDGYLYESTGIKGKSTLRKVELRSGKVVRKRDLPSRYFGEGITRFEQYLIQLTWRSNTAIVYDYTDFQRLASFSYPTEGWGLTHDGTRLIMSDGSANLYFLDPHTFERLQILIVSNGVRRLKYLNELEYIDGLVFANIYRSARIALIDPSSGHMVDSIDLQRLVDAEQAHSASAGVLNGIAYDAERRLVYVTGKNWSQLFELRLIPEP